ncbi:DUF5675 family protein [Aquimarina brevivitae]|uniref:DUF5675 domain-containing protein n=1 Tax=Aquimarina brevivitae TaxID=323412 RepID=A0A4Q7P0H5_9FLAO|nr:DUF5675 family protein [Aquimarina brevivitae]RZS93293.1 hypothetical protein EV197_1871 [Aquimarina brevivitae]
MKRFFALLLIAALILAVVIFFTNPKLLDKVWLWLIGFAGSIIGFFRNIFDQLKGAFGSKEKEEPTVDQLTHTHQKEVTSQLKDAEQKLNELKKEIEEQEAVLKTTTPFLGTTITLIRYTYDEHTTLGLLYVRDKFTAYTLEDTYREEKIKGKTRIPSGTYQIGFREITDPPSPLTQKYRNRSDLKDFFTHHLEVKNVENFNFIYIHIGNDHGDTDGCILIADGIHASSLEKKILSSVKAYTKFYKHIKALLEVGEPVRLVIYDEDWIEQLHLNNLKVQSA